MYELNISAFADFSCKFFAVIDQFIAAPHIDSLASSPELTIFIQEMQSIQEVDGAKPHFAALYIDAFFEQMGRGCYLIDHEPTLAFFNEGHKNIIFIHNDEIFFAENRLKNIQKIDPLDCVSEPVRKVLEFLITQKSPELVFIGVEARQFLITTILLPNLYRMHAVGLDFSQKFILNNNLSTFIEMAITRGSMDLFYFFVNDLGLSPNVFTTVHPVTYAHQQLFCTLDAFGCTMLKTKTDPTKLKYKLPLLLAEKDGLIQYKNSLYYYDITTAQLLEYKGDESPAIVELMQSFSSMQVSYVFTKPSVCQTPPEATFIMFIEDDLLKYLAFPNKTVYTVDKNDVITALRKKAEYAEKTIDQINQEVDDNYVELALAITQLTKNEDSVLVESPTLIHLIKKLTARVYYPCITPDLPTLKCISQLVGYYHSYYNVYFQSVLSPEGNPAKPSLRTILLTRRVTELQHIIQYLEVQAPAYTPHEENIMALSIRNNDEYVFNKCCHHLEAGIYTQLTREIVHHTILNNNFHVLVAQGGILYLGFCLRAGGYTRVPITNPKLHAFINFHVFKRQSIIDFKQFPAQMAWVMELINANQGYDFFMRPDNYAVELDKDGNTPFMCAVLNPGPIEKKLQFMSALSSSPTIDLLLKNAKDETIYHRIFAVKGIYEQNKPTVCIALRWMLKILFSKDFALDQSDFHEMLRTSYDKAGYLPLHAAIHAKQTWFVKRVLEEDSSLANVLTATQQNLLFVCLEANDLELFNYLHATYHLPLDSLDKFQRGLKSYAASADKLEFMTRLQTLEGEAFNINLPLENPPVFFAQGSMYKWFIRHPDFDFMQRSPQLKETVFHYLLSIGEAKLVRERDLFSKAPELLFAYDVHRFTPIDSWVEYRQRIPFVDPDAQEDDELFLGYIMKKLAPTYQVTELRYAYDILLFALKLGRLIPEQFVNKVMIGKKAKRGEPLFHALERSAHVQRLSDKQFIQDMIDYDISVNVRDGLGRHILAKLITEPRSLERIQRILHWFPSCQMEKLDASDANLLYLACAAKNTAVIDWLCQEKKLASHLIKYILQPSVDGSCVLDLVFSQQNIKLFRLFWNKLTTLQKITYLESREQNTELMVFLKKYAFFGWNNQKYTQNTCVTIDAIPEKPMVVVETLSSAQLIAAVNANDHEFIRLLKHTKYESLWAGLAPDDCAELVQFLLSPHGKPNSAWNQLLRVPYINQLLTSPEIQERRLLLAIQENNELLVGQLLSDPTIYARFTQQPSPVLAIAIEYGHHNLLSELLSIDLIREQAAQCDQSALRKAFHMKDVLACQWLLMTESVKNALEASHFDLLQSVITDYQQGDEFARTIVATLAGDLWWTEHYLQRLHATMIIPAVVVHFAYPQSPEEYYYLESMQIQRELEAYEFSMLWFTPGNVQMKRSYVLNIVRCGDFAMLEHVMSLDLSQDLSQDTPPILMSDAKFYNRLVCEAIDGQNESIAWFLIKQATAQGVNAYQAAYNNRLLRRSLIAGYSAISHYLLENPEVVSQCDMWNNYALRLAMQFNLHDVVAKLWTFANVQQTAVVHAEKRSHALHSRFFTTPQSTPTLSPRDRDQCSSVSPVCLL